MLAGHKKTIILLGILIAVGVAVVWFGWHRDIVKLSSMTAHPSEVKSNLANSLADNTTLITVREPTANSLIHSPLHVSGEVSKTVFIDDTFPIQIIDVSGAVLAETVASTSGQTDTTGRAFFAADIAFSFSTTSNKQSGFLILRNHNPSGDPEHDVILAIPVRFR